MRRKKGKRCRRDQKKKRRGGKLSRKAALIREQQRGGRIGEKGIFCSLTGEGLEKARLFAEFARFLLGFLNCENNDVAEEIFIPGCIRGRISFEREHEKKGGWGVCFVAVETIFRTNGGGRWRGGSRFAGNVKGFVKEFLGDSYEMYGGGGGRWLRDECAHEVEPVTGSRWRLMLTTRSCTRARFWLEIMRCSKQSRSSILPVSPSVMSRYRVIDELISHDRCAPESYFQLRFLWRL